MLADGLLPFPGPATSATRSLLPAGTAASSCCKQGSSCCLACRAEEVGSPYLLWREKGFTVDLASVEGGEIPWDQASLQGDFFTPEAQAFMSNGERLHAT